MNTEKNKKSIIYIAIISIVSLALIFLSFYGYGDKSYNGMFADDNLTDISQKWTYSNGAKANLKNISTRKNDVSIYYKIPTNLEKNQSLILLSHNIVKISVYAKSKKIYSSEKQIPIDWLSPVNERYETFSNRINIPEKYKGYTVRLRMSVLKTGNAAINDIYLGTGGAFISSVVKKYAVQLLIAAFIVFLGIAAVTYSVITPLFSKIKKSLRFYGTGSILLGLWQLTRGDAVSLIFGHYSLWRIFTYPVAILLPLIYIISVNSILNNSRDSYITCGFVISVIEIAYMVGNYITKGRELSSNNLFISAMSALSYVVIIYMLIRDRFSNEKVTNSSLKNLQLTFLIGDVFLVICHMIDCYFMFFDKSKNIGFVFLGVGYLLVQIVLFYEYLISELHVTQLQTHDDTFKQMAYYDQLTGLYSQSHIIDLMNEENAKSGLSDYQTIIYMNVSKFKLYNVVKGHDSGDKCLKKISNILKNVFKTKYISRFGNDHFVIFYNGNKEDEFVKIEEANKQVSEIDENFRLYLKAGIYYADGTQNAEVACDLAKTACDMVKDGSRQCYKVYTDEFSDEDELTKHIIDHFDDAIANGDIQIYYQPQVHLLNGKLTGFEALARWIDPDMGFLSPGIFIPVLENSNLTYKLDSYVLEQSAKLIRERLDSGKEAVPISFNLSRTDFMTSDPYQNMLNVVDKYNIPHELLQVEITESTLIDNPQRITDAIDNFHKSGFQVLMDDFGSGFSSLNTLKEYNFDEIKLDMVFMRKFDQRSRKVIKPLISMAKSLNVHTLCEGVETQEQVDFLKSVGCETVQGYFYGKPNLPSETIDYVQDHNLIFETPKERHFISETGLVDVNSNQPLALLQFGKNGFQQYYMNNQFRTFLGNLGVQFESNVINWGNKDIDQKITNLAKNALWTNNSQSANFAVRGTDFSITLYKVAQEEDLVMFHAEVSTAATRGADNTYMELPLPYIVVRPVQNSGKEDLEYVFVNRAYCDKVGKTEEELLGKHIFEVFPDSNPKLLKLTTKANISGKPVTSRIFSKSMHAWADFTLMPAQVPGCVSFVYTDTNAESEELSKIKSYDNVNSQAEQIAKTLNGKDDYISCMDFALEEIAQLVNPEHVFIVEQTDSKKDQITFQWSKSGSELKIPQELHQFVDVWDRLRGQKNSVYIENIETLHFSPAVYDFYIRNGIIRTLLIPLFRGNTLLAYIGVDNLNSDIVAYARDLLLTSGKYLGAKISSQQRIDKFTGKKSFDHLTGVGDSNALTEKISQIGQIKSDAGLVYADLYDLKDYNSTHGPQAGDLMIQQTAELLVDIFEEDNVYRISGEEFVVFFPLITEDDFENRLQKLKNILSKTDLIKLLYVNNFCVGSQNVVEKLQDLKEELADAKADYYASLDS